MARFIKILKKEIEEFRRDTILSDDWKAESIKYEKIGQFVTHELNKLPIYSIKHSKLINTLVDNYRINSCYIFDDYDYSCEKIGENLWFSKINFCAEIETKMAYHGRINRKELTNTIHVEIQFEYYIFCKRIINEKFIGVNIR